MRKNNLLNKSLITFLFLISISASAQISEGGIPPSLSSGIKLKKSDIRYAIPIEFDVNRLKKEDVISEAAGAPLRVAYNINVDLNMDNAGTWSVMENGQRIWRLSIECPDAIALILKYSEFDIPTGAKLFIYNNDYSQILGAYTSKTNPSGKAFATEAVAGDNIVLEYAEANDTVSTKKPKIQISGIGYCYNYVSVTASLRSGVDGSGSCQVNINCSEGDEWQHHKKGVAKTLTPLSDGWYLCSGSLVNNTSDRIKPYYLSAHHCFFDEAKEPATFSQMIFYFHFESEGCDRTTNTPATTKTMVGAQLLVDIDIDGGSDGALLLLNDDIPESYDVYYNGWDISENPSKRGVGIHHPKGDVKKISTYTAPAISATWWDGEFMGAQGAHWNVIFTATKNGHGVTEGGSSGSPLFNENQHIVGTLSGGNSSCSYKTGRNLYGKLSHHWDKYPQQMKTFLDEANTGKTSIEGRYVTDTLRVEFTTDDVSIIEGDSIVLKNSTYRGQTYSWIFEGGSPYTSTDKNPTVIYNTPGFYDMKLIVDKGLPTEKSLLRTQYIEVTPQKGIIIPNSLTATVDPRKDRINLEWERRGLLPNDDVSLVEQPTTMDRNNDNVSNIYQRESIDHYRILSKWTVEDMALYKNITLTSIKFIPCDGISSCILKIRQDGVDLLSKNISSLTPNKYNDIVLDIPVSIDVNKDLYIGYEIDKAESLLASYSNTPIVKERNMLWFDNKNYYAESFGIEGNWHIKAEAIASKKSEFWYTIYRDGQLLASDVTTGHYVDYVPDMSRKAHCYTVNANFQSGRITKEETQCIDLPTIDKIALLIYDKASKQLRIVPKSKIQRIHIYNLSGQIIGQYAAAAYLTPMTLNTENWGTGVRIIRIETEHGIITYKIFVS